LTTLIQMVHYSVDFVIALIIVFEEGKGLGVWARCDDLWHCGDSHPKRRQCPIGDRDIIILNEL